MACLLSTFFQKDGDGTAAVRNLDFYHGFLARAEARELLKEDGDFLLRKSEYTPGQSKQEYLETKRERERERERERREG